MIILVADFFWKHGGERQFGPQKATEEICQQVVRRISVHQRS